MSLGPDEHQKVEATALTLKHLLSDVERAHVPESPRREPWFQTANGRPLWLTPDDRAFLSSLRITAA